MDDRLFSLEIAEQLQINRQLQCLGDTVKHAPLHREQGRRASAQDIERYPGIVLRMLGKAFLQPLSSQGGSLFVSPGVHFLSPAASAV